MATSEVIPPYEMDGDEIAEVFFKLAIYIVGAIGNLLVIFMIVFLGEYKKITHWYVLQMAIADILFLHNLPFKVTEDMNGRWIHSQGLCSSQQTVLFLTYYASIMFLTIMAIDRYLAVYHPMSLTVQRIRTSRNAYIVAVVTWIIAIAMSVPEMIYSTTSGPYPYCKCVLDFPKSVQGPREWCISIGENADEPSFLNPNITRLEDCILNLYPAVHNNETCIKFDGGESGSGSAESGSADGAGVLKTGCFYDEDRPGWKILIYFNFVAMFVIPLLVIVTCYGLIVIRLKSTTVVGSSTSNGDGKNNNNRRASSGKSEREKNKVTILCALLALLFTIFWLPFHAMHMARLDGIETTSNTYCQRLSDAVTILAYLSSATNPYLYNFLGSFKKRWRQIRESEAMRTLFATATTAGGRTNASTAASSSSDGRNGKSSTARPTDDIPLGPTGKMRSEQPVTD